ncbi:hypothetical protein [Chitinivorax sp. B]|uniref:glycine-rich domain-containing protein n=1 Tax=Chitinivorax sp. B TaxID=2502235 RepID=UPI00148556E1|nr:hypothetical protein [Chitinivorax sp. B]
MLFWLAGAAVISTPLALRSWRRSVQKRRLQFIQQYQFPGSLLQRFKQQRPELSEQQVRQVEAGLRQYFRMTLQSGRKLVAMPSRIVDELWHEFILFTRNYQSFCKQAFGYFLHHTPAAAMSSEQTQRRAIKRAWYLACQDELIPPRSAKRVPLIFGLDLALSIPGGFYYVPDCNQAVAGGADSGGAYCGADVASCSGSGASGCSSSGCSGGSDGSSCSGGNDGGSSGCSGGGCGGGGGD